MGAFENHLKDSIGLEELWKKQGGGRGGKKVSAMITTLENRLHSKDYLDETISSDPQAVFKVVSSAVGSKQVGKVMDYITREHIAEKDSEKLSLETDEGEISNGKDARQALIKEWSTDFSSKEAYEKQEWKFEAKQQLEEMRERLEYIRDTRKVLTEVEQAKLDQLNRCIKGQYKITKDGKKISLKVRGLEDTKHIILSVGGKQNVKKATQATRQFLQRNFGANGFQYAFTCHNDTDNLHFHLIVKTKSKLNEKLRFDKADLFVLRKEFAKSLSDHGISRSSTLRKDRVKTLEKINKGIERIKERESWYQKKMSTPNIISFNVFQYRAGLLSQSKYLIDQINREIRYNKSANKSDLKKQKLLLQNLHKKFSTINKEEFGMIKRATLRALEKDHQRLSEKVQDIKEKETKQIQTKDQKKSLKEFMKKHKDDLKQAKNHLTNSSKIATKEDKESYLKSLDTLNKMIKATKGKSLEL